MLWICDIEENNGFVSNYKLYVKITIRTSSLQKSTIAETHLTGRNIGVIKKIHKYTDSSNLGKNMNTLGQGKNLRISAENWLTQLIGF